jgi:hypothetical protein
MPALIRPITPGITAMERVFISALSAALAKPRRGGTSGREIKNAIKSLTKELPEM